jgi:hypothetical protein
MHDKDDYLQVQRPYLGDRLKTRLSGETTEASNYWYSLCREIRHLKTFRNSSWDSQSREEALGWRYRTQV